MTIRISEIYQSLQGEGLLTGAASVFIRTSGCNLRCWFCDTPFTSWNPEGENVSVESIVAQTLDWDCQHVVITGGEPTLVSELKALCLALRKAGRHITIESAGTVFQEIECDLISISPKLGNSTPTFERAGDWALRHERTRHRPEIVAQWIAKHPYQLKFVIDNLADAEEVLEYLDEIPVSLDPDRIMLMPQGIQTEQIDRIAEWLIPWCQDHDLRYCDRAHIRWFGHQRGT